MATQQATLLGQVECSEGTFLEKSWGEYLNVSLYAMDDASVQLCGSGICQWTLTPQLPKLHDDLFYTVEHDAYAYQGGIIFRMCLL